MIRAAAGYVAVAALKLLAKLPVPLAHGLGQPLLPLYLLSLLWRPRMRRRLSYAAPPGVAKPMFAFAYYSVRLRLALLSLRHLLGRPDGCNRIVENEDLYHAALATGKPVVLLGWHQGPVELLHRIPHENPVAAGRRKVLMTAGAFSPALAAFMRAGRAVDGKDIATPGDLHALRRWERDQGVLAVMIDQAPGQPEAWIRVSDCGLQAPYPSRLLEWIEARQPERLFVSVLWEPGNRIRFRYSPAGVSSLKADAAARMATTTEGLGAAQYNWSYTKLRLPD